MAGAGANSTAEAIELSRYALKVGADCTLSVVPYYNKPSQEGIYRHFKAIAEAVDIPMVLYNVPSRTVADMQVETALRLAQVPGIVGIKEASGDIERLCWLVKRAPPGFSIYSGDDGTAVALMLLGGHGHVSVTANVAPRAMQALCAAALAGNAREAARLQSQLLSLHKALFVEPSPAPTKWALGAARPLRSDRAPADHPARRSRQGRRGSGVARSRARLSAAPQSRCQAGAHPFRVAHVTAMAARP